MSNKVIYNNGELELNVSITDDTMWLIIPQYVKTTIYKI